MPAIKEFKQRRQAAFYLDLANDDFICNRNILKDHHVELVNLLHLQKHRFTENVDIVGYMMVPPTPFYRKDWEKPDSFEMPYAPGNIVALDGFISVNDRLVETFIDLAADDTIENTVCINPGQNEGRGSNLRYVILELKDRQTPPKIRIIYEPE